MTKKLDFNDMVFSANGTLVSRFPQPSSSADVRITTVVIGLVMVGNRTLLMQRVKGVDNGKWAFVGGKVDAGETKEQALARELREEIGIHLKRKDRQPFATITADNKDLTGEHIETHFYLLEKKDIAWGLLPKNKSREGHPVKWATYVDALGTDMVDVNDEVLVDLFAQNAYFRQHMLGGTATRPPKKSHVPIPGFGPQRPASFLQRMSYRLSALGRGLRQIP